MEFNSEFNDKFATCENPKCWNALVTTEQNVEGVCSEDCGIALDAAIDAQPFETEPSMWDALSSARLKDMNQFAMVLPTTPDAEARYDFELLKRAAEANKQELSTPPMNQSFLSW